MVTFADYFKKSLTEAKFRQVSIDVEEAAEKCSKVYFNKYRNKTSKQLQKITIPIALVPTWQKYFKGKKITSVSIAEKIEVTDLATNEKKIIDFIVAFGEQRGVVGFYDEKNEIIVLFDLQSKDLSPVELTATLVHELTHSTQQYKTSSEEYEEEVDKMSRGKKYDPHIYFMEPHELDAHLTELAFRIKKDFYNRLEDVRKSKERATKVMMKRKLEKFLLELMLFIRSGAKTYFDYEELPIPEFLSRHEEFVETLKNHPKEWKKLKQRLVDLYAEFQQEEEKLLAPQ